MKSTYRAMQASGPGLPSSTAPSQPRCSAQRQVYSAACVIPVSRDSSVTEQFSGGSIRRNTDSFNSSKYLDISRHPTPHLYQRQKTVPTSLMQGAGDGTI